ncbi:MAG: hypothetical protein LBI79_05200 [Nitrososphaerota archaeon]|jgi:hypothetical protein|nr:hypothetical protein [Nitrososphaerota archaeon]
MSKGVLVAFRVYRNAEKAVVNSQAVLNRFVQKFYGQDASSHGGRYFHHKRGLLEDIAHIRLIRGVIIVRETDLSKVLDFLNTYNAEVYTREVTLTPEDEKKLSKEN